MRRKGLSITLRATLATLTLTAFVTTTWAATEKVLHRFNCNGTEPNGPYARLTFDTAGNLYGTTNGCGPYLGGTVFELKPKAGGGYTEKVLHSFNPNGKDGAYPDADLIFDVSGNLYGTTYGGGAFGDGTVFELTPKASGGWAEKVLHSFNRKDGTNPRAGLIFDAAGNLYGTTLGGGTNDNGTVFELMPKADGGWAERVLHDFKLDDADGAGPYATLVFDGAGNLYGTTSGGGTYGFGTVFELMPKAGRNWAEKVLHDFKPFVNGDGANPDAGLIFDAAGNLYGTTSDGGHYDTYGTVFELTPVAGGRWTEKVLHSFNIGAGGYSPVASLIFDAVGNLYGTTPTGGAGDYGTVFELTPVAGGRWTEKVLHRFNGKDGSYPYGSVIFDGSGNLYGTTSGVSGEATAFEIMR